jgi:hypothetical protein
MGAVQAPATALAMPAGEGWLSRGPGCAVVRDIPELRNVWLGHFSGGRYEGLHGDARALDWKDQYACFASRASCQSWQRHMRARYGRIEGYRTCLPIR